MARNFYPGTHLITEENIVKKKVTFQSLSRSVKNGTFQKPDCQGALLNDKVKSMVKNYLKNPSNFQYKNTIVVGVINETFYIIDGQHRVQMIIELCKNYQGYNRKTIIIAYYPLSNTQEAMHLFNEINIDSCKNQFFITQDYFGQMEITEIRRKLKDKFNHIFSRKKTINGVRKCIEEFSDELYESNFLKNKITDEAFNELIKLNNMYYDVVYKQHVDDGSLDKLIYKDEGKSIIDNGICFVTKKNNFLEYITNPNIKPLHTWRKGKKRITKTLKRQVWYKEFKYNDTGICPIIHCNTTLNQTQFEAGHVISEFNNGPTELSNLRPICKQCNVQMGSHNWNEYDICTK